MIAMVCTHIDVFFSMEHWQLLLLKVLAASLLTPAMTFIQNLGDASTPWQVRRDKDQDVITFHTLTRGVSYNSRAASVLEADVPVIVLIWHKCCKNIYMNFIVCCLSLLLWADWQLMEVTGQMLDTWRAESRGIPVEADTTVTAITSVIMDPPCKLAFLESRDYVWGKLEISCN